MGTGGSGHDFSARLVVDEEYRKDSNNIHDVKLTILLCLKRRSPLVTSFLRDNEIRKYKR